MTDDLPTKIERLTAEVVELRRRGKDRWDKFQILAALLIPVAIALVGFKVSESIKEAETASAQKIASGNEAVARINAKVGQAGLVKAFMDALVSDEPRKRKLAIESVLIALPEDGPRLVKILAETDPDEGVRQFSKVTLTAVAEITDVNPRVITKGRANDVSLNVSNIVLKLVSVDDLSVAIGGKEFALSAPPIETGGYEYTVKFEAPSEPPDPSVKQYQPVLLVGKSKQRVGSRPGLVLTYP